MINGAILILIQSISLFRMAMSPGVPLMGYTYINLLFNDLPSKAKQIDSVNSFKYFLARGRERASVYYYTGKRLCQTLHTRLLTNCSSLNYYLFSKHITDSPLCLCGTVEDANHYFFECRIYAHQRILLFDSASQFHVITLNLLLFGDPTLSLAENTHILDKVQKFIIDTKRF